MITQLLSKYAQLCPDKTFIVSDSYKYSFKSFLDLVQSGANYLNEIELSRVYLYAFDSAQLVALILSTELLGKEVCVLNRSFTHTQVEKIIESLGEGLLVTDSDFRFQDKFKRIKLNYCFQNLGQSPGFTKPNGKLIILTTGTTGVPKAVSYSWKTLFSQTNFRKHKSKGDDLVWLLAYPLNHIAGIQILNYAKAAKAMLVIPRSYNYDDISRANVYF